MLQRGVVHPRARVEAAASRGARRVCQGVQDPASGAQGAVPRLRLVGHCRQVGSRALSGIVGAASGCRCVGHFYRIFLESVCFKAP